MIFKTILWFTSFSVFLFIDEYCPLTVSFLTFLFLAYFSHRIRFWFYSIISHFFDVIKVRFICYQLTYLWIIISYFSKVIGQLFFSFRQLLSFKKISVSTHSAIKNCEDTEGIEKEIDVLVQKISQYYLYSWYDKLSDNDEFVILLSSIIKETLNQLCTSILNVDKKKLSYIVLQIYLHFFSHFVEAKKACDKISFENVQMKHWAMKDTSTERCYLQSLVSALVDKFGPTESEHSLHSKCCSLLHAIVVEILTETLIQPIVKVLCDPSRINNLILRILLNTLKTDNLLTNVNFSSKDSNKAQPVIILPVEEHHKPLSENGKPISMMSSQNQDISLSAEMPDHEGIQSLDIASLLASGLKSSSDNYLSDNEHSDFIEMESAGTSSASCDNNIIKRSKSADYIRQMPQLKALNEKGYEIRLHRDKFLVSLKTDSNSHSNIEQAEEAVELEVPTLFTNIRIIDTVQQNEDGIIPYTLYCIQYCGIFHDARNLTDSPQLVHQIISIKRRFSEFVTLQSRLEDNPILKNYLKRIKGPSKWSTLPFSNLDKKYIAERKIFLENYLKTLCAIAPIAQSSELQEFLAYGGDARISFVRRTGDINVPRIDKFFVRGVKGAIDMFKTALPNSALEIEGLAPVKNVFEDSSPDQRFNEFLLDFSSREPEIKEHVKNFLHNSMENPSCSNISHKRKNSDSKSKRPSLLRNLPNFVVEECCACKGMHDDYSSEENLLGDTIIELLDVAINLNTKKLGDLRTKLILLLSPLLNRFMVNKIDSISEQHLSSLLHSLHIYLWPDETNQILLKASEDDSSNLDKIADTLKALISSYKFLHNGVYSINSVITDKIKLFILSLQYEELNKCLLFHIFDAIIEHVCEKKE